MRNRYTFLAFLTCFTLSFSSFTFAKKVASTKNDIEAVDPNIIRASATTSIQLKAKQAIVVDFTTGKILLEKNAHEQMLPSSMTKMMTSYLIEEKIKKGEVTFDAQFIVSEKAWRMGGTKS